MGQLSPFDAQHRMCLAYTISMPLYLLIPFPNPACSPVAPDFSTEVMSFDDERALLLRWRDLMLEADPDIIIGYNIVNFDLPYLLNRADTLKIPQFWTWGRLRNRCGGGRGMGMAVPCTLTTSHHSQYLNSPGQPFAAALQEVPHEGCPVFQQGVRHS
jgi:hypothetical protein